MMRAVVFVAIAAFRPDPCCEAADCYGADCDQGHPVAESALLTGGDRRRVEWASRALSSVVGHAVCDRSPWPHWTRESCIVEVSSRVVRRPLLMRHYCREMESRWLGRDACFQA
jgi:hypothetical protein